MFRKHYVAVKILALVALVVVVAQAAEAETPKPGNGGFFLRIGFGGARVHVEIPEDYDTETGLAREFEKDTGIAAFGLGYEWMVNDHYSLGFALDARGGEIDDFGELETISFGESTFGVSMNYFF